MTDSRIGIAAHHPTVRPRTVLVGVAATAVMLAVATLEVLVIVYATRALT